MCETLNLLFFGCFPAGWHVDGCLSFMLFNIYNRLVNACTLKPCDWIVMSTFYIGKSCHCIWFLRFIVFVNFMFHDQSLNPDWSMPGTEDILSRSILCRGWKILKSCWVGNLLERFVKLPFLYSYKSLVCHKKAVLQIWVKLSFNMIWKNHKHCKNRPLLTNSVCHAVWTKHPVQHHLKHNGIIRWWHNSHKSNNNWNYGFRNYCTDKVYE